MDNVAVAAAFPWWGILTVAIALIAAWSMLIIVTVRWQMERILGGYDKRFEAIEGESKDLRKEHAQLAAQLPIDYTRKEDYIRQDVRMDAKLDAIYELIDEMRRGKWEA